MEARIDLSPLAPRHADAVVARIAARGMELRKLRRAIVRRGVVAVAVAAAAGLALFLSAPHREARAPSPASHDLFDLATRTDVDPYELLELGGSHAQ